MSGSRALIARVARALRRAVIAGIAIIICFAPFAPLCVAQTDLGAQRVGTASGTFLKIAVDAQGAGMAGAAGSFMTGAGALFWNPAGLGITPHRELLVSAVDYTADIPIGAISFSHPVGPYGLGVAFTGLRTSVMETDEYHPLGTGREVSYNAWTLALGASRGLTDKLFFGAAAKLYRESFAPEIGGPAITTWLIDIGAVYFVGYRDARLALAMQNFGPDLRPGGTFDSRRGEGEMLFTGFSPPTFFRFAACIDPVHTAHFKLTTAIEMGHPADNQEALRFGFEGLLESTLALRAGYDAAADALKLHAGLGLRVPAGERTFFADYAYSDGGYFGNIHRWSLRVLW